MLVEPKNGGPLLDAIAFNIDTRYYPDLSIKQQNLLISLEINEFSWKSKPPIISRLY